MPALRDYAFRNSKVAPSLETTFIYVTHDQTEAMTMADRIAVMRGGNLEQLDTPRNLYNYPKYLFRCSIYRQSSNECRKGTAIKG